MKILPDREVALFNAALQRPVGERAAYLDRECGGDDVLRRKIEGLLRVHDEVGTFLENPTQTIAFSGSPASGPSGTIRLGAPLIEKTGERVGPYKLLQQIGEGGCGVVYMAEQTQPVRRKVALKVIKLGMDTKNVIARFEAERQALALMDHPNIAKVLDAGATDTGRPFFVMELVKGVRITDYCDQNNLSTKDRLNLFTQVCHAIQHAHQKGIIHRDIKPSNILVTLHDGVPVPKVIDFGIAKATTDQPLTDKTLFTAFEQFIGTPAYMSPEQAEMTGLDIDTRTDVYALGVLLYELLTGRTPFDPKALLASGIEAMRRTIREQEPERPSTALSTMLEADLTQVASQRQSDAPKLIHLIRGDLDWIVMKALEKDRTRRYETANGLAMDVQRYLTHEPVNARPPSALYRFQKLAHRNRIAFVATGAVVAALVAGLTLSTALFIKERHAHQRAIAAEWAQSRLRQEAETARAGEAKLRIQAQADEQQAKTEAAKSRQVAQFLKDMLNGVGPSVALGRDTALLKEILEKTGQQVGTNLAKQPEVEAELRYTLGEVYWELGDLEKAEAMHRAALAIRIKVFGNKDPQVAQSMTRLGHVLWRRGRLEEAEKNARAGLAMQRELFGSRNLEVARSLEDLTAILNTRNNLEEAEAAMREALATKEALLGHDNLEVADTMDDLAAILSRLNKGVSPSPEAAAIRRQLLGADNPLVVMASLRFQAGKLEAEGRFGEAEAGLNEYLAAQRKIYGKQHPTLAQTLNRLAALLKKEGKLAESEATRREALAMQRNVLGEENVEVAQTLTGLGTILTSENKLSEAEDAHRSALAMRRKVYGNDNINVAYSLVNLGQVLEKEGKLEEARNLYLEAANGTNSVAVQAQSSLAVMYQDGRGVPRDLAEAANWYRKAGGKGKFIQPPALRGLAEILRTQGKPQEAEKLYEDEIALARENLGKSHRDVANLLHDYGYFLLYQDGKPGAATEQYLKALAIYRVHTNDEALTWTLRELGDALLQTGKPKDAEPHLRQSLALYRKLHRQEDRYGTAMPARYLADALYQQHRLAEAEAAYRDALATVAKCPAPDSDEYTSVVRSLLNVLKEENKPPEEALCRKILAQQRAALTNDNPVLIQTLISLATTLQSAGRRTEAQPLFREVAEHADAQTLNGLAWPLATDSDPKLRDGPFAVALAEKAAAGTNRTNPLILDTLAAAYAEAGQFTNAVRVQQEVIGLLHTESEKKDYASRLKLYENHSPYRDPGSLAGLASDRLRDGKFVEAEVSARECLAVREREIPDDWRTFNMRSVLGGSLLGQTKYAEAEPLLLSGCEGMMKREDKIPAIGKPRLTEAHRRLVQLYEATAQPERAAVWKDKLAAIEQAQSAAKATASRQ